MCQRIGRLPTGTIGLGLSSVSSRRRVPSPPQRTKTGTLARSAAATGPGMGGDVAVAVIAKKPFQFQLGRSCPPAPVGRALPAEAPLKSFARTVTGGQCPPHSNIFRAAQ